MLTDRFARCSPHSTLLNSSLTQPTHTNNTKTQNHSFTYSHTLSGHEFVSNEDFEKAISCFRHALRTDERHYNAWYGLGAIYYRQEKFEQAEYHYKRALAINKQSSVLHCHLGMCLQASKKYYDALDVLAIAFKLEPNNPQATFQRANVLIALERDDEALLELYHVRDHAPREASVHFLIGKVCKRLGMIDDAMSNFMTALDLDHKDNNVIKNAIANLRNENCENENDDE